MTATRTQHWSHTRQEHTESEKDAVFIMFLIVISRFTIGAITTETVRATNDLLLMYYVL